MGGYSDPKDLGFLGLVIGEVFLLEVSDVFFWPWGSLGGGGRFFEEMVGMEEEDEVDCVHMIFEIYEHHGPIDGAKFFWTKINLRYINQIVWKVMVL